MYVLTEKSTGGVYAIENKYGIHSVHVFELEDDAIRYHELLKADDYSKELEILEVDPKVVALNCENYGYAFSIIGPDELIVPPHK
tara:strand:- start:309 stop:563 length:255 start_codon:yes stop_codon:yes gene_type:complete